MACRDPETLICPTCNRAAELVWVVGEGPNTKPGEGPAYVDVLEDGGWLVKTAATNKKWTGVITCPACNTPVLNRS